MSFALLAVVADETGTYIITASFVDEAGDAVTPNTVLWDLMDYDDNIINEREDESETPDTSVDIVLSGDDLAVVTDTRDDTIRRVYVHGTYDSTYGDDLPYRASILFKVEEH